MKDWLKQYIGKLWVAGTYGPSTFDCWGLVWHVSKYCYGREIPKYQNGFKLGQNGRAELIKLETAMHFVQIEKPEDGCFVGLGNGRGIYHVGIYVEADGGLVLHCYNKGRTVAESLVSIKCCGFSKIEFYRWQG